MTHECSTEKLDENAAVKTSVKQLTDKTQLKQKNNSMKAQLKKI